MGAWGTEWNANDRIADIVDGITEGHKYDALNSGRRIIMAEAKKDHKSLEHEIDNYRAMAMIYKNITLSLNGYPHLLDDESKTFLSANRIIEEFLNFIEDDKDYESQWVNLGEYISTVRSELHEFQEWLQTV